jgi:hypothetical protein
MAFKARYETKEAAPEWLREHLRQIPDGKHRGKWIPDVESEDGFALDDIKGLKGSLESERAAREKHESDLRALREAIGDVDITEARKALDRMKKSGGDLSKDEAVQALIATATGELKTKLETDVKKATDRAAKLEGSVRKLVIRNALHEAITKAKGNAELLMPHAEAHADVDGLDGDNPRLVFLGEDGKTKRLSLKSGDNGLMGADEFVQTFLVPKFPPAFAGPGTTGSGAGGHGAPSSTTGRIVLTREQAKNPQAYQRAKDAAAKTGQGFPEIVD